MIPYDELVAALGRWRERQGLSVNTSDLFSTAPGGSGADLAADLGVAPAPEAEGWVAPAQEAGWGAPAQEAEGWALDLGAEPEFAEPGAGDFRNEHAPAPPLVDDEEDSTFVGASPAWGEASSEASAEALVEASHADAADRAGTDQPWQDQPAQENVWQPHPEHDFQDPASPISDPIGAGGAADIGESPASGATPPEAAAHSPDFFEGPGEGQGAGGGFGDLEDQTGVSASPHVAASESPAERAEGGDPWDGAAETGGEDPLTFVADAQMPGSASPTDRDQGFEGPPEAQLPGPPSEGMPLGSPDEAGAPDLGVAASPGGPGGDPEAALSPPGAGEPAGGAGALDWEGEETAAATGASFAAQGAPAGTFAEDSEGDLAVDDSAIVEEDPIAEGAPPEAANPSATGFPPEAQTTVRPAPAEEPLPDEPAAQGGENELDVDLGDVLEEEEDAGARELEDEGTPR